MSKALKNICRFIPLTEKEVTVVFVSTPQESIDTIMGSFEKEFKVNYKLGSENDLLSGLLDSFIDNSDLVVLNDNTSLLFMNSLVNKELVDEVDYMLIKRYLLDKNVDNFILDTTLIHDNIKEMFYFHVDTNYMTNNYYEEENFMGYCRNFDMIEFQFDEEDQYPIIEPNSLYHTLEKLEFKFFSVIEKIESKLGIEIEDNKVLNDEVIDDIVIDDDPVDVIEEIGDTIYRLNELSKRLQEINKKIK